MMCSRLKSTLMATRVVTAELRANVTGNRGYENGILLRLLQEEATMVLLLVIWVALLVALHVNE